MMKRFLPPISVTRILRLSLPIGAVLLCTACGGGGGGESAIVIDSAGVEIVTSTANSWVTGDEWTVETDPEVSIGTVEGDSAYELSGVGSAIKLKTGEIVVTTRQPRRIRFYTQTGVHIRSVGREGDGPGEFRGFSSLQPYAGDSLVVFDPSLKRVSVLTQDGSFLRSFRLRETTFTIRVALEGQFENGSLFVTQAGARPPREMQPGVRRDPVPHILFNMEGDSLATLLFPGTDRVFSEVGSSVIWRGPIFARSTYTAVSKASLFVGMNEDYVIDKHSPDGRLTRSIRLPVRPVPLTEAIYDREVEEIISAVPEDRQARARSMHQKTARPPALPFYSAIRVDPDGYLWVKEFTSRSMPNTDWSVFDPDGRLLGQVVLPEGLEVYQIGRDYVLGRWRDELDVEYVRLYGLNRAGGNSSRVPRN